MKKLLFAIITLSAFQAIFAQTELDDSINMGNNYVNDVYYKLADQQQFVVDRSNWDIAFGTDIMSATVFANNGAGIEVTEISTNANDWATIDTNGLWSMPKLYNSIYKWDKGAFNQNETGHPDYGWGRYDQNSHNVKGEDIFVLKLQDGSYKKFMITEKKSSLNTYVIKYADLDGSNEINKEIDLSSQTDKNFVGYVFNGDSVVNRDPMHKNWDLLFTKYIEMIDMGPVSVPYPVMGILTNIDVKVAKVTDINEKTFEDFYGQEFIDTSISVIGRKWKENIGTSFPVYAPMDSLVYFISTEEGDIFKFYITGFQSGSSGEAKVIFKTKLLQSAGIADENTSSIHSAIYPNPNNGRQLNLIIDSKSDAGEASLQIIDLNGKLVLDREFNLQKGMVDYRMSDLHLAKGEYILTIGVGMDKMNHKLIVID